ncbi:hypothetical protein FJR38_26895 [Anabaena sp. UHCC 0253]|uniref:hypothetical protein n=1 Tax=Anabaena sp. UHCC 0253 TaxID=2590019 RepID=UPI001444F0FF|nr:hypothetical protein [Anabaena sp. UHCC 0253]MTJ56018.1 hypothetical protein [Anabaena sp. UHCC 0253]
MTSPWRLSARSAIQSAIASVEDKSDLKAIKKAIDSSYPFGTRGMHPYKIWLDERREHFILLGIKVRPLKKVKPQKIRE